MMFCATCGHTAYGSEHVCPPAWWAWDAEEYGDDVPEPDEKRTVYAWTAEAAAERWAELYDEGEISIADGNDKTVCVEPVAGGAVERFDVSGHMTPTYSARPHRPTTPWLVGGPVLAEDLDAPGSGGQDAGDSGTVS